MIVHATQGVCETLRAGRNLVACGWSRNKARCIVDGKIHYCALAALAATKAPGEVLDAAFMALRDAAGGVSVAVFNARSSQDGVVALYDRAFAAVEGGQS